jgi:Putative prokaryotic signal transducing protein
VSGPDAVTVPVAVARSRVEADLIVGLLESGGIRAFALADDAGGQEPQWQLSGGVRVMVESSDESAARDVLADARGRDAAPGDAADEELR